jgi:uncharacterized membrane protein YtjA (UPF0391 family)
MFEARYPAFQRIPLVFGALSVLVRDLQPFGHRTRTACGRRRLEMIGWAVTFLIIALVAAVLGFTGIAGVATNIAWILFVVGLVLAVVFAIFGRRGPI